MAVRIGHASIDENGKIKNGKAGDQTGKEVKISNWYPHKKGWVLLRCVDPEKAALIAECMEKACRNVLIGYDQWQRDSLFNYLKDKCFDPDRLDVAKETDCSALIRVCIAYAFGKDVAGNIRTVNLPETLVKTGLFKMYTSDKYCKSSDYLRRGDILCTPVSGHVVCVLDDGPLAYTTSEAATEAAHAFDAALLGTYKTTGKLNIRSGAGTKANTFGDDKTILVNVPKDTQLLCLGAYTTVGTRKWLYVHFELGGVVYTGFASTKYLVKG